MVVFKSMSDQALVVQFVQGQVQALEVLIERYKDKVYSYIFVIVKNEALAEDVFQETFIKVIKSLKNGRYNENGKFLSWVNRIAHNLIIDHYRREKNQSMVFNEGCDLDLFNNSRLSEKNVEDEIVEDQIFYEVRLLIEQLPEDQREVVRLRHYMGMSFKEIADQTGVSINTSLGRMRYAILNMRKMVDQYGLSLTNS